MDMFDKSGNMLFYEEFMFANNFPIPLKEFQKVVKAIPNGLIHLMKSHLMFARMNCERKLPELVLNYFLIPVITKILD